MNSVEPQKGESDVSVPPCEGPDTQCPAGNPEAIVTEPPPSGTENISSIESPSSEIQPAEPEPAREASSHEGASPPVSPEPETATTAWSQDPSTCSFLGVYPPEPYLHHQHQPYLLHSFDPHAPPPQTYPFLPPSPILPGQLYFDMNPPLIAVAMPPPHIHAPPMPMSMPLGFPHPLQELPLPQMPFTHENHHGHQHHEPHGLNMSMNTPYSHSHSPASLSTPPHPHQLNQLPSSSQHQNQSSPESLASTSSQFVPSSWEELRPESERSRSRSRSTSRSRLVEYVGDQFHDKNPHTRRTIILNPRRNSKNDPVVFYRFYQFSCTCMGKVWFSPLHRAKDGCFCRDCHLFIKPFGFIDGLTPYMGHELCYGKFECHVCGRSWSCQKSRSNFPDNCFNCGTIVYPYYQVSHSVLRKKISRANPSTHFLRNPSYSESSSVSCEEDLMSSEGCDFNGDFLGASFERSRSPGTGSANMSLQQGHSSCITLPVCSSQTRKELKDLCQSHSDPQLNFSVAHGRPRSASMHWGKHDYNIGRAGFRNHRK